MNGVVTGFESSRHEEAARPDRTTWPRRGDAPRRPARGASRFGPSYEDTARRARPLPAETGRFSPPPPSHLEGSLTVAQLKRQWKTVVALTLAGMVVGVVGSLLLPQQYDAEAKIMVSVNAVEDASALSQGSEFSQQRVRTYMTLATSRPVMQAVIDELGLEVTAEELADQITAEAVPETVLLRIVVRDTDAQRAALIADTTAAELMEAIEQIESGDGAAPALVRTVLVEAAAVPTTSSAPSVLRNALFATIAGFSAAVLFIYLRVVLDTRIRTPENLTEEMGIPLLAKIPRDAVHASDPMIMTEFDPSGFSEAYRLLRTRLRYANIDGKLNTIMITSVTESEGKSSVASLLATAVAESGLSILLIDGDLRRPSIATKFGLEGAVGLTAVLTRQAELAEAIQHSDGTGVDVLAAGMLPPNPAELLESLSMHELVQEAGAIYDLVIIDAPPFASTADATSLSTVADAVLLVVRADGKITQHAVERAMTGLSSVGSRVLGVVATFVKLEKLETPNYY